MGKKSSRYVKETEDECSVGIDWNVSGVPVEHDASSFSSSVKSKSGNTNLKSMKKSVSDGVKKLGVSIPSFNEKASFFTPAILIPTYPTNTGTEKFRADYRQFSALLLTTSVCMLLTWIPELANPTLASTPLEWAIFVAAACQALVGMAGTALGVLGCFYDFGHIHLTVGFIGISLLTWLPFATQIAHLALAATSSPEDNPFVPFEIYSPSQIDIIIFGVMATVSAAVYSISTAGPVVFSSLFLYEYQRGAFGTRSGAFFRKRAYFYNTLVIVGGCTMFLSGLFAQLRFGSDWNNASSLPIHVGMYLITSPPLVMAIGILQLVYGSLGTARTVRRTLKREEWSGGNSPSMSFLFPLFGILTLSAMVAIQAATPFRMSPSLYGELDGTAIVAVAPTSLAASMVGFILMPIFLDAKLKVTPEELDEDHYGDLDFLHLQHDRDLKLSATSSFSP